MARVFMFGFRMRSSSPLLERQWLISVSLDGKGRRASAPKVVGFIVQGPKRDLYELLGAGSVSV